MLNNLTVATYTLGCKVNQYESEALAGLFERNGYSIVDFNEAPADVYVINTCSVTSLSERKSRQIIRKAKSKNPHAVVVVMGCYSQTSPQDVAKLNEADIILGTKDRDKIIDFINDFIQNKIKIMAVNDIMKTKQYEPLSIESYKSRTRANIKIQEGCSQFCSYCIIPYARGPSRSRSLDDVLEEVKKLSNLGYKEIILTGIHLASYGFDLKAVSLAELIEAINEQNEIERIRLGSIEPNIFTQSFINNIKYFEKLCPHFHISLQSGSNQTLKRMNRKYTTEQYAEVVDVITSEISDVSISTDVMVGFPGETDEEFENTVEFLKKMPFSKMHVFKYSPRKGTPAAKFENQILPQKKEERSRLLIQLSDKKTFDFNKKYIGRSFPVLFEENSSLDKGYMEGFSPNYIKVLCKGNIQMKGKIYWVKFEKNMGEYVVGEILE